MRVNEPLRALVVEICQGRNLPSSRRTKLNARVVSAVRGAIMRAVSTAKSEAARTHRADRPSAMVRFKIEQCDPRTIGRF